MNSQVLKDRTKAFAIRIIKMTDNLPSNNKGYTIGRQIIRSSTSIAANYRAACRARSTADFISKITIVEEEADETQFWLELIEELELISKDKLIELRKESKELTAIFTAAGKTSKNNSKLKVRNSQFKGA